MFSALTDKEEPPISVANITRGISMGDGNDFQKTLWHDFGILHDGLAHRIIRHLLSGTGISVVDGAIEVEHKGGLTVVPKTVQEVIEFLHLDYSDWVRGFPNVDQFIGWLTKSRFASVGFVDECPFLDASIHQYIDKIHLVRGIAMSKRLSKGDVSDVIRDAIAELLSDSISRLGVNSNMSDSSLSVDDPADTDSSSGDLSDSGSSVDGNSPETLRDKGKRTPYRAPRSNTAEKFTRSKRLLLYLPRKKSGTVTSRRGGSVRRVGRPAIKMVRKNGTSEGAWRKGCSTKSASSSGKECVVKTTSNTSKTNQRANVSKINKMHKVVHGRNAIAIVKDKWSSILSTLIANNDKKLNEFVKYLCSIPLFIACSKRQCDNNVAICIGSLYTSWSYMNNILGQSHKISEA